MMPVTETIDREVYKVGRFTFDAEDRCVTVTKDTSGGILTISHYQYRTHEQACDAAWRMAKKQSRA